MGRNEKNSNYKIILQTIKERIINPMKETQNLKEITQNIANARASLKETRKISYDLRQEFCIVANNMY